MEYDYDERPVIEFPTLVIIFLVLLSLSFGLSFLFLPWMVVLILFAGFCITVGIIINPFIGVVLFLLTTYIHVMAHAPVELIKAQPAVLAGGIVLFAWLFHLLIYKDFRFPKSGQFFSVASFWFMLFLSFIFHYKEYESFFLVFHFVKMFILYFLIINLVKTRKEIYLSLILILVLTFSTALSGVLQYLQGTITASIDRVAGFEGNPNALAVNLVFIVPFIIGLVQYFSSFKMKLLFFLIFLVNVPFVYLLDLG